MAAIQVNIRVPEVLLKRIDAEAGEGRRSEWILQACRMRLDGDVPVGQEAMESIRADMSVAVVREHDVTPYHPPATLPVVNRQALQDICDGKRVAIIDRGDPHFVDVIPAPPCIVCESPMREVKGKWACQDVSCGKYGVEQKVRA